MSWLRWAAAALAAVSVVAACGDDDSASPGPSTTEAPVETTAPPSYEGDPDSPFCQRSRAAADQPVLDPFEAGLEPREVELRFRALAQRFEGFAEVAPEPLAADLTALDESFDDLADALESAGYDFARLAAADVDVSLFDDPAFTDVAARLAAYQDQVCNR